MNITLTNNFHNTEATIRPYPVDHTDAWAVLSHRQIKRAWNKLCGIPECTCGNFIGSRGPQAGVLEMIQDRPDGAIVLFNK